MCARELTIAQLNGSSHGNAAFVWLSAIVASAGLWRSNHRLRAIEDASDLGALPVHIGNVLQVG